MDELKEICQRIRTDLAGLGETLTSLELLRRQRRAASYLLHVLGPFTDFFVRHRLSEFTLEKAALWEPVLRELGAASVEHPIRAFIESGSTLGCATVPLAKAAFREYIQIVTNNILVRMSLHKSPDEPKLLPYRWDAKYWGTFPFTNDLAEVDQEPRKVLDAYKELGDELAKCDVLFLTASRFHLREGPFTGSVQNVLFKHAAFNMNNKRRLILLDGAKLLLTDDGLRRERDKEKCVQVFAPTDGWSAFDKKSPIVRACRASRRLSEVAWPEIRSQGGTLELWVSKPVFQDRWLDAFGARQRNPQASIADSSEALRTFELLDDIRYTPEVGDAGDAETLFREALDNAIATEKLHMQEQEVGVEAGRNVTLFKIVA